VANHRVPPKGKTLQIEYLIDAVMTVANEQSCSTAPRSSWSRHCQRAAEFAARGQNRLAIRRAPPETGQLAPFNRCIHDELVFTRRTEPDRNRNTNLPFSQSS
jgi:hypothetical protein